MKNKKGFTLLELIVVIAILGILSSVVLVSLSNQRIRAHQASAIQSVSSGVPFAVDCATRGGNVNPPAINGYICGTTGEKWPVSLPGNCKLMGDSNQAEIYDCGTGNTIICSFITGACK